MAPSIDSISSPSQGASYCEEVDALPLQRSSGRPRSVPDRSQTLFSSVGVGIQPAISAMRLAIRLAAAFSGSFAKCAYLAVVSTLL